MHNRDRMAAGLVYDPTDPELTQAQNEAMEMLYDYNATRPSQGAERTAMLERMLASIGRGCHIEPPFHANWAGRHVQVGDNFYANFNLTLVDDGPIHIGDHVMLGPNVTITTGGHPVWPELRLHSAQFNLAVIIGDNVWIGAGVQIMPGVTIGNDTVIGAGSVVTRDIPGGVVAVGTPCRVVREIGDHDRTFYWRDKEIDVSLEDFTQLRSRTDQNG